AGAGVGGRRGVGGVGARDRRRAGPGVEVGGGRGLRARGGPGEPGRARRAGPRHRRRDLVVDVLVRRLDQLEGQSVPGVTTSERHPSSVGERRPRGTPRRARARTCPDAPTPGGDTPSEEGAPPPGAAGDRWPPVGVDGRQATPRYASLMLGSARSSRPPPVRTTSPVSSTYARSERDSACCAFCSTSRTVVPCALISDTMRKICWI